jgi:hypothetical protein
MNPGRVCATPLGTVRTDTSGHTIVKLRGKLLEKEYQYEEIKAVLHLAKNRRDNGKLQLRVRAPG